MEVRVLGAPAGDAIQRAWYTYRDTGSSPQKIGAALVVGGPETGSRWAVARVTETSLAPGEAAPESVHPGAPHSRELPLLPEGPAGTLLNLDTGNRCPISGEPRALAVTGPGLPSFDIWVASVNPGVATDLLVRTNWFGCDADTPINIGKNPVDIETLGRVEWQEVYVASRDNDTVTIVTAAAPATPNVISLTAGSPSPCVKCPRSLAVVESAATVCRAVDLQTEVIGSAPDVRYSWDGLGCETLTSFKVWCRCLSTDLAACPTDCTVNCPPSPLEPTGETWCEIDIVISDPGDPGGSQEVRNDGENTQTHVEPNDN